MVTNRKFLQRRIQKHERSGGSRDFHKFREGKNVIRILPFNHTMNKFDVLAGRCEPDDVGHTSEFWFLDVTRIFHGMRTIRNCLDNQNECPIWQEYWSLDSSQRSGRKPKTTFMVNAIDMDEPQKGVQLMSLSEAYFLGETTNTGERKGLGIWDYYNGFDPEPHVSGSDDEEDPDQEEGDALPRVGLFNKISAQGDAMIGFNGRDILIYTAYKSIGKNKAICLDHTKKTGAISLRAKERCEVLERHWGKGTKDLFMLPFMYPGWAADGKHLNHAVSEFLEFIEGSDDKKKTKPKSRVVPDETDPDQALAPEPDNTPGEVKEEDPTTMTRGDLVVCVDKYNDDNTSVLPEADWTYFNGIFDRLEILNDDPGAYVHLRPEDQDNDQAKEILVDAWNATSDDEKARGGPFFWFPLTSIEKK